MPDAAVPAHAPVRAAFRALNPAPARAPGHPPAVGPTAVTRLAEAIEAAAGAAAARAVFAAAGLLRHLDAPPEAMVAEEEVARLYGALRHHLGAWAGPIAAEAGRRTGDYLLARRIPAPARLLLARLPRPLAAALLVRAIDRHAWTFAGSGRFSHRAVRGGVDMTIAGGPLVGPAAADPLAAAYAAIFQRVFAAVLGPATRVEALDAPDAPDWGRPVCLFRLRW